MWFAVHVEILTEVPSLWEILNCYQTVQIDLDAGLLQFYIGKQMIKSIQNDIIKQDQVLARTYLWTKN